MKRDMNLVLAVTAGTECEEPKPDLSTYTEEQRVYHSALLIEARIGSLRDRRGRQRPPAGTVILWPTWAGHEFLDAARNDTIWHNPSAVGSLNRANHFSHSALQSSPQSLIQPPLD